MIRKVSIPIEALDRALSILSTRPGNAYTFLLAVSALGHGDIPPDPPPGMESVWPDIVAEISRQHRAAQTHARCGVAGGRPKKETDYDDGQTAFTASMEAPLKAEMNAVTYIEKSGIRMTPNFWEQFRELTADSGLPDDLVIWAVDKAATKEAGWTYVRAILDRCITQDIRTVDQAKAAEEKRRTERSDNDRPSIGTAVSRGKRFGESDLRSAQAALKSQYGGAAFGTDL